MAEEADVELSDTSLPAAESRHKRLVRHWKSFIFLLFVLVPLTVLIISLVFGSLLGYIEAAYATPSDDDDGDDISFSHTLHTFIGARTVTAVTAITAPPPPPFFSLCSISSHFFILHFKAMMMTALTRDRGI
jgi:hypothetical protein